MSEFEEKVFSAVGKIPKGRVTTYGAIAFFIGKSGGARAVGNALHKNDKPIVVPCHRVVHSDGSLTENFVFGGENVQKDFLEEENIKVINGKVDIKKYGWYFEDTN